MKMMMWAKIKMVAAVLCVAMVVSIGTGITIRAIAGEPQEKVVPKISKLPTDPKGSFIIYIDIDNEARADPLDIKIYIDGKIAVNQDFPYKVRDSVPSGSTPPRKVFRFKLSKGVHKIVIESVKRGVKLEKEFEIFGIKGKHWGVELLLSQDVSILLHENVRPP